MHSKSSTFLALTSILAILAVLSIAINDMENPYARKPFMTSGKASSGDNEQIALSKGWDSLTRQSVSNTPNDSNEVPVVNKTASTNNDINYTTAEDEQIIDNELKFTAADQKYFKENFKGLNNSVVDLNLQDNSVATKNPPTNNQEIRSNLNQLIQTQKPEIATTTSTSAKDLVIKNVNNDSLRLAGYTDFVIKPKPLEGKMFGELDVSMLDSLGIIEKNVFENRNGNDVLVLVVYEFNTADKNTLNETYDFLKAQAKGNINNTINETNQFGLSSFYINFNPIRDHVFLVVKTRNNVYALSYPKANFGSKNYFQLTSNLLKELI